MRHTIHGDYAIGHPDGWLDLSTSIFAGPPEGGFSPTLTVTRERLEEPQSAAEYAVCQLPVLRQELGDTNFQLQSEGHIELAGQKAFERTYDFSLTNSAQRVRQWQIYFVVKQDVLTITATDKAASFEGNRPTFRRAIERFHLVIKD